jgi:hypothetical protein
MIMSCEQARVLSLDGGMKVLEGSTIVLSIDGSVRALEHQHSIDSGWMKM